MLNKEKYAKEIIEIAITGNAIAKVKGKLRLCGETACTICDFYDRYTSCKNMLLKWANSEYVEQIDWNKVEDGTPIWVRSDNVPWEKRTFALEKNGKVVCYSRGDENIEYPCYTTWKYAKLTDPYEEKQNELGN